VEHLAQRNAAMSNRDHECLRDIIGMNVMDRPHAEIGQGQYWAGTIPCPAPGR
jgi:hypothetical protein